MKMMIFPVLLSGLSLLAGGAENLIRNGSFEEKDINNAPAAWTIPKNARLAPDAAEGKSSLEFNGAASQWGMKIPPGQYQIRFQLKKDNQNWLGIRLFCRSKDGKEINNKELSRYFGQGKAFPEWTTVEYAVNVPEGTGSFGLIFSTHGGLMLLDDVSIRKAEMNVPDGELVLEDSFNRKDFGKDWIAESGSWKIENGGAVCTGVGTESILKFARPLGKNLRLEYTCSSSSPQDLSATLGDDPGRKGLDGYVFGFGASYNSYNYIASTHPFNILERTIQEGFNTGVVPSQKHRIVVEKREGKLRLIRDGKLELATEDMFSDAVRGESFALFTYGNARFEDIKVYRLPESKSVALSPEYKVEKVSLYDFSRNSDNPAGKPSKIIVVPTWDYARSADREQIMVNDPCLETSDAVFPLPGTDSAIVEFDLFSEGGKEIRAGLADPDGKSAVDFVIAPDGRFFAEGEDGRTELTSKIEYRRRLLYDTLALTPDKWHTFRLKYDLRNHRIDNIALLDYYTENQGGYSAAQEIKQGDYISLGGKIPMKKNAGNPVSLRFHSENGPFLLDNVLLFGPAGFKSVNGKNILLSGRKLLNLKYPPRRDPMLLKTQSMRHLDNRNLYVTPTINRYRFGEGKPSFQKWASSYNKTLMENAFLRERLDLIDRRDFYLSAPSSTAGLRKEFSDVEQLQEKALQTFADAFWHNADETLLKNTAEPALNSFRQASDSLREKIDRIEGKGAAIPANPIYFNWNLRYDPALKKWTRDGTPEAFISSVSQLRGTGPYEATEFVLDKMRALGIQPCSVTVGGVTNGAPKEGELFNVAEFQSGVEKSKVLVNRHKLHPYCLAWMQHGTGQLRVPVPKWWLDRNQSDSDIFFSFPDGKPGDKATPIYRGWPQYPFLALNFWNPKVQDYFTKRFFEYGRMTGEHKDLFGNTLFYLGGEASSTLPNGLVLGYSPSTVKKFRAVLKEKYGSIEELNRKWETRYSSFDAIVPPPPGAEPSPLRYEFNTFVHREYFNLYIRMAKENLEKGYGGKLAIGHDMQDTFSAFDMPAYFDNVSIALFHSYQIWDRKIYPKYLESLAEATGTPWGAIEWGYTQGCKTMFDLEEIRRHGLRELSHQLMFGCVAPNFFADSLCGGTSDWQYGFSMTDHRTGFLPFNYFASYWRVAKDRGVRFGEIALTSKTVRPDVAVLEVDSARRNALPDRSVYAMCKEFSGEMEAQSLHYGFLFEKLVADGRQKLDGIPVIFVPNGIVMTETLDRKLEAYVRGGGVLIAFAPPGVFNEFGKPKNDGLLSKAFPGVKWTHENFQQWSADGKKEDCFSASLGKGFLYVFPAPTQFENNKKRFLALLKKHIDPVIVTTQNDFQYSFRERNGVKYLYVLNYSIEGNREGEFSLKGHWSVKDISLPDQQKVKSEFRNGRTIFHLRLTPSELALLEISEQKG